MIKDCPVKYLPKYFNNLSCLLKIFLYIVIFSMIICLIHYVSISKKFTYNQRFGNLLKINFCLMIIAYLNKEYSIIICMILAPLAIIICASTHEYLYTLYPNDFQRLALFEEKESYMFLPKWALIFYSNFVYMVIFSYKVVDYIFKYHIPISL
jgi:hypothetical protein